MLVRIRESGLGGDLGRRCRGQGISPKIWGAEYAELKI